MMMEERVKDVLELRRDANATPPLPPEGLAAVRRMNHFGTSGYIQVQNSKK